MKNARKYLARFKVEASTPIRIGSGHTGLLVDELVVRDANGLPYIPGTSLAGVIRHELEKHSTFASRIDQLFGFQNQEAKEDDKNKGQGSRIVFSSAQMLAADGQQVHEGLAPIDFSNPYYKSYLTNYLPERDHVKITDKGVAATYAKYEEQVVYKGTRFVFEVELTGTDKDKEVWEYLIKCLRQSTFRVGAGTRKGLGGLTLIALQKKVFNLAIESDLLNYLKINSSLDRDFGTWETLSPLPVSDKWKHYQLTIRPENFFLFGSGLQDTDADEVPKIERYFKWDAAGKAQLTEAQLLIPATSIKGAISHRLAFHYNKLKANKVSIEGSGKAVWGKEAMQAAAQKALADISFTTATEDLASDAPEWDRILADIAAQKSSEAPSWKKLEGIIAEQTNISSAIVQDTGELNEAVVALFGKAKNKDIDTEVETGQRGKVLFSDIYKPKIIANEKVFNHVAIDRFTGGGIDGALFQEKVTTTDELQVDIYVEAIALKDPIITAAFEAALKDLTEGRLPLGGHTTKGHGVFKGTYEFKKAVTS